MKLRNRVKAERESQGLTQARLCELADVSRPTMIAIERDDGYTPLMSIALRIAGVLRLPLHVLFWEESAEAAS